MNFVDLRKRAGLSQVQLAELCDIDQSAVSAIECGKVKSSRYVTVERFAAALGVTPAEVAAAIAASAKGAA